MSTFSLTKFIKVSLSNALGDFSKKISENYQLDEKELAQILETIPKHSISWKLINADKICQVQFKHGKVKRCTSLVSKYSKSKRYCIFHSKKNNESI
jgi:hypothetical protein